MVGCCPWLETGLEFIVGSLRRRIVGILNAKNLGLKFVCWAGLCPLRGAYNSHPCTVELASCGTCSLGTLKTEGN